MVDIAISFKERYFGINEHFDMLLVILILMAFLYKKFDFSKILIGFALVYFGIYLTPFFIEIITTYCIPSDVYWRMWWILPVPTIVCYALVKLIELSKDKNMKKILIVLCIFIICITGNNIYNDTLYSKADNIYKLPQDTLELCDYVNEHNSNNNIEEKRVFVPNSLVCYIRQYDAGIKMPYGRNVLKGYTWPAPCWENVDVNLETLVSYGVRAKCNYLIWPKYSERYDQLMLYDWIEIGESDYYYVLYRAIE